jgi:hypothetical protein
MLMAMQGELVGELVADPTADDQQAVDAMLFQGAGDVRKILCFRRLTAGAQLARRRARPSRARSSTAARAPGR